MPDLEISKSSFDALVVYAAMAHPSDECYRDEFLAAMVARCLLEAADENKEDIEIPASIVRILLNAPSYEDIVERATNSAKKGSIAGDILDYIAQMHFTGHKQPSVRKAVYVAEDYLSNAVNGYGEKSGSSNIFIYKCWDEYKTVAHLWAAFRVRQFASQQQKNNGFFNLEEPLCGDYLDKFLTVAEVFRIFGEGFAPPIVKSHESLLPKDETWKVPESYSLPNVYLSIQDMPDWIVKRLKGYSKRNV